MFSSSSPFDILEWNANQLKWAKMLTKISKSSHRKEHLLPHSATVVNLTSQNDSHYFPLVRQMSWCELTLELECGLRNWTVQQNSQSVSLIDHLVMLLVSPSGLQPLTLHQSVLVLVAAS